MMILKLFMMCLGILALFHTYHETGGIGYLIAAVFCSVLTIHAINSAKDLYKLLENIFKRGMNNDL